MKKIIYIILLMFGINSLFAQVEQHVYELNSIDDLITTQLKEVLNKNLANKKVVFLGEAEHHMGSDLLAKTEFVKYLVLEKGYKDIAFEGDFLGLFFEHDKINLYSFWSRSVQCKELFEFLKQHNVTIWGFDNQMSSAYTYGNFTNKLTEFLNENSIIFSKDFIQQAELFIKNRKDVKKVLNSSQLDNLNSEIDKLLKNETIIKNNLWLRILESFKSAILMNTTHKSSKNGIPIRDAQMAKNLDFLVKSMPDKKFIVWLANSHMTKYEYDFMKGKTMGGQFVKLNPEISYHIAVSSIYMPYRSGIEKYSKDKENLLHFLPSTENNYFMDAKQLITDHPEFAEKEYDGMFNLDKNKTNWFKHFDALVFISKGEKVAILP